MEIRWRKQKILQLGTDIEHIPSYDLYDELERLNELELKCLVSFMAGRLQSLKEWQKELFAKRKR